MEFRQNRLVKVHRGFFNEAKAFPVSLRYRCDLIINGHKRLVYPNSTTLENISMKVSVHFKNDAAFLIARGDDSALFYRLRPLKSYLIKTIEKQKQD